jgi:hypothetical protein
MSIENNPPIQLPMKELLKGNVSLRAITFTGTAGITTAAKLDNRTCALVLAIQMNHVTGTASVLAFYHRDKNTVPAFQCTIPSATANGSYDGFSASTSEAHAGWLPIFLPPQASIMVISDATATFTVYVLEWKIE